MTPLVTPYVLERIAAHHAAQTFAHLLATHGDHPMPALVRAYQHAERTAELWAAYPSRSRITH